MPAHSCQDCQEKRVSEIEATVNDESEKETDKTRDDVAAGRDQSEEAKKAEENAKKADNEQEVDQLGLEKPPLEVLRGMISGLMDLLSQATGGDSVVDGAKELIENAEAASIDRSISMLQAHRSCGGLMELCVLDLTTRYSFPRELKD